jgi:hypothetical protein
MKSSGMLFIPAALLLAASVSTAWAQRAPDPTGFGRMSNPAGVVGTTGGAGFGRLIYPGTGAPVAVRNPRLPGSPLVAAPPQVLHRSHGVAVAVPYPVFYGGNYYDYEAPSAPYSPGTYQAPSYGNGYDQMTQPPVVIINQYFRPDTANPVVRDYSNVPLPEPGSQLLSPQPNNDQASTTADQQVMFLIALKDHTIFPAIAYWVEADTLNYITVQGAKNSVSLDLVDRDFSKQINKERKVEFGLPGK